MANKRYYWIKLKKDFFSGMHQRKMRKQPHGELLLIIYLKMMLATCDSEGKFYYQGVFDDIATEIAETIIEEVEDVRIALKYLSDNGLVDLSPDECYTPEVMRCVGSECDSAERVRTFREKKKMLQSNTDVTGCNEQVTESNTEKRIDKDIELDIDKDVEVLTNDSSIKDDNNNIFNTTSTTTVRRENNQGDEERKFTPPTFAELMRYKEDYPNVDLYKFFEHYEGNGWTRDGLPMTSWKAALKQCNERNKNYL